MGYQSVLFLIGQASTFSTENFTSTLGVYYCTKDKRSPYDRPGEEVPVERRIKEVVFNNEDVNFAEEDLHLFKQSLLSFDNPQIKI